MFQEGNVHDAYIHTQGSHVNRNLARYTVLYVCTCTYGMHHVQQNPELRREIECARGMRVVVVGWWGGGGIRPGSGVGYLQ